jgi:protein-L-isoaspartate O-methyltransferase
MIHRNKAFRVFTGIVLVLLAGWTVARAQEYEPKIGQKGKDVMWAPTPHGWVEIMLNAANLTPADFLIDLGSGDGRIVIAAAKRGVRAMGIEYNPDLVELSKREAEKAGISDKVTFVNADFFTADFSNASFITMYLYPKVNLKLRPRILDLSPGTRIVAYDFDMGGWTPDQVVTYREKRPSAEIRPRASMSSINLEDWEPVQVETYNERHAFLWIVPAKVAGVWTWPGQELTLHQKFQVIEGTLIDRGKKMSLKSAKLKGDQISFQIGGNAGSAIYAGRVNGSTIEGIIKVGNGPETSWTATRRGP